jgi:hypothetical protein
MSDFKIPVPMLPGVGKGGSVAAAVVALLIVLALAARRDPTAPKQTV